MEVYLIAIATIALIYVLLGLGLTMQFGMTGLINFGHVGFFAIGAYASALLTVNGLPIVFGICAAAVLTAIAALPVGLITLRLRDDYFAIATLGFSEAVRIVLISEKKVTGGIQGIPGIPPLFRGFSSSLFNQLAILSIILATVICCIWAMSKIARSPFGRTIEAIRDNEEAVRALGKDPARFKIQVLIIGAALAGIAGAFYGHYLTYISPDQFIPLVTFYVWMAIIMGGAGRISGAVLGSVILMLFLEGSRFLPDLVPALAGLDLGSVRIGLVGLALILFTLYRPQGIVGDYTKR